MVNVDVSTFANGAPHILRLEEINGVVPEEDISVDDVSLLYTAPVAPVITSAPPAGGTVGVPYTHTYTATGTTPITYSLTAGVLPTGLTLSATGVISGTPTATGTFAGTVTATNGTLPDATQNFSITIVGVAPVITSAPPAGGTFGVPYTHTYTATGTAPITYSVTAGVLPTGLTLSAAGVISGTPTAAGTFAGTVTATNGTLPNATQNFSIVIGTTAVAPTITSVPPVTGLVGTAYTHTYTATGTAPITYSVTAGALPPGLTLSAAGVISGTPTAAGIFAGTVTATNGMLPDATQNFSIAVISFAGAPVITSAPPAGGTVGTAYTHTYTATGATPINYSVTAGALPPGLTLSAAGVISGTPTTAGTFTGTVTATNGIAPDATQNFSIVVVAITGAPVITSAPPAGGTVGTAYTHTYTATGTTPITYSVTAGALPTGLTLSAAGVISGTPTTAGTFTGTVTATNGIAPNATQNFSIVIGTTVSSNSSNFPPPPPVPTCNDLNGTSSNIARADVPSGTVTLGSETGQVYCRILVENQNFIHPAEQVGNKSVLDRGVIQAVDVFALFGSTSITHFNNPVKVCLLGSGTFIYLDATQAPRTLSELPSSFEGGYTCATLPNAGTVVLVPGTPGGAPTAAPGSAPVAGNDATGALVTLNDCRVTTKAMINLRAEPGTTGAVITLVPFEETMFAVARQGAWFKVDYRGTSGWLAARFVSTDGSCGN